MTTPQKLAQDVASRAASMARKTNMRLLGVVENMSGDVFGTGGGEELAAQLDIPLLGTVPLDPALREQGDLGVPVVERRSGGGVRACDRRHRRGDRRPARSRRHRQVAAARRLSRRCPRPPTPTRSARSTSSPGTGSATSVRTRLHDDVSWHPAREGAWKPVRRRRRGLRTLLWRAGMNKIRPADMIDLGDRVVVQLRGRGMDRLGAKGLFPRLFQIVVFREGKVVSIQDYPRREDAFAAAGLKAG